MSTKVKICGVTRPEDADLALSLGADYIGINVYEKSPRSVGLDQIPSLLEAIPEGRRVLVDVAPSQERLEAYLDLGFDFYQLHFDLDVSMAAVAAWSGLAGPEALWVAPRIPPQEQTFPQILMEFSETILLDTYSKAAYGGTGESGQNWQRFLDCTLLYQHKKWVLAGGLSPDNVREALAFTQADTIDVASGVESSPGIKDPNKLKEFFKQVHLHDQRQCDS
ncbi:MAG: phosphoribosylanthranilate isomerase [Puniceicoccaceae bacterium]